MAHTLRGRITFCAIAILAGLIESHRNNWFKLPEGDDRYQDYKILQKYFDTEFENIGEVPWNLIQKDCSRYNKKRHTSKLDLGVYYKDGALFTDSTSEATRFYIDKFELYTQLAFEILSPVVDDAYAPETVFKQIHELNSGDQVNTTWKNIVINKKCYHLLEEIKLIPNEFRENNRRLMKKYSGWP